MQQLEIELGIALLIPILLQIKLRKSEIRTIRGALSRVLNESLQYNQLQLISAKVIVNTMI